MSQPNKETTKRLFPSLRKKVTEANAVFKLSRVLLIAFGNDPSLSDLMMEDARIYGENGFGVVSHTTLSVTDLMEYASTQRPAIVHLLAKFTETGSLEDESGQEVPLKDVLVTLEESGMQVLFLANTTNFSHVKDQLAELKDLVIMIILDRNRHYASFFSGLLVLQRQVEGMDWKGVLFSAPLVMRPFRSFVGENPSFLQPAAK
jgi:hypothetical protein